MPTEHEPTLAEIIEYQEREHPVCDACGLRIGLDCPGHCVSCGEPPAKGQDLCKPCFDEADKAQAERYEAQHDRRRFGDDTFVVRHGR